MEIWSPTIDAVHAAFGSTVSTTVTVGNRYKQGASGFKCPIAMSIRYVESPVFEKVAYTHKRRYGQHLGILRVARLT